MLSFTVLVSALKVPPASIIVSVAVRVRVKLEAFRTLPRVIVMLLTVTSWLRVTLLKRLTFSVAAGGLVLQLPTPVNQIVSLQFPSEMLLHVADA